MGLPTYQVFSGALDQFWPDALPVTTNDSHGCQWALNQSSVKENLGKP